MDPGELGIWVVSENLIVIVFKENLKIIVCHIRFEFYLLIIFQFELASTPWSENRDPLLATLQAMVASKAGSKPVSPDSKPVSPDSEPVDQDSKVKKSSEQKLDSLHKAIKPGTK